MQLPTNIPTKAAQGNSADNQPTSAGAAPNVTAEASANEKMQSHVRQAARLLIKGALRASQTTLLAPSSNPTQPQTQTPEKGQTAC